MKNTLNEETIREEVRKLCQIGLLFSCSLIEVVVHQISYFSLSQE